MCFRSFCKNFIRKKDRNSFKIIINFDINKIYNRINNYNI